MGKGKQRGGLRNALLAASAGARLREVPKGTAAGGFKDCLAAS
jgi:hypothetical protein